MISLSLVVERLLSQETVARQRAHPNDVAAEGSPTFEGVYARWFSDVVRWVRALGGLDADLEDIAQDVFIVVRRKLDSFDGRNVRGWLYRITQRTVRDYRRRARLRRVFSLSQDQRLTLHDVDETITSLDPSEELERREAERCLGQLLARMTDKRRTVFMLFEIEGYSGEEIAELEGVAINTIWTRLHHARKDFAALVARARRQGKL
jgi:RNA polymerase sigma-70 factor (ECF subfamily)